MLALLPASGVFVIDPAHWEQCLGTEAPFAIRALMLTFRHALSLLYHLPNQQNHYQHEVNEAERDGCPRKPPHIRDGSPNPVDRVSFPGGFEGGEELLYRSIERLLLLPGEVVQELIRPSL